MFYFSDYFDVNSWKVDKGEESMPNHTSTSSVKTMKYVVWIEQTFSLIIV